jgi:phosphoserine phosphatase|tara:strand:- start:403 stop:954 length:552 start_codon:yes stop_codon:yes gene_type:complete
MNENRILFVDLDGTLIKEDLSDLAFVNSLKTNPLMLIFYIIVFLFKGKSYLKEKISKNYIVPIEKLNFNNAALDYIKDVKKRHRVVYLISGSHQLLVDQIDKHLRIFFESFGTNIDFNMVGENKVKFINNELKILEFDYLGNSKQDLPIWKYTKRIIFTNVSEDLREIINSSKLDKFEIEENF